MSFWLQLNSKFSLANPFSHLAAVRLPNEIKRKPHAAEVERAYRVPEGLTDVTMGDDDIPVPRTRCFTILASSISARSVDMCSLTHGLHLRLNELCFYFCCEHVSTMSNIADGGFRTGTSDQVSLDAFFR